MLLPSLSIPRNIRPLTNVLSNKSFSKISRLILADNYYIFGTLTWFLPMMAKGATLQFESWLFHQVL